MGNLFRKEAIDNYKDQFSIEKNITKLSFSTFFLVLIFILGLIFTVVWFIFGNVVNTVDVTGIVYPTAGIDKITASISGIVSDITIKTGESVKAGDIIAVIPNEEVLKQLNQAVSSNSDDAVIEKLRQDYYNTSVITSKTDGTVLSVSSEGAYVNTGDAVASVAARRNDNNQRQIFAFIPTSQKNNISKGCAVQVSPNYAPREKFGYINGYVADIGESIITKSDAQKEFAVYNIPNILDENETYIAVYINLLSDENTESGLYWSESRSGNINVETGTVCSSSIVISEKPPYKWLLGGGS
ncbi:MAG: biotin/lipoyl-binding protein [Clostridia bacterium]|nr:biotin/lipoyl-binding protein [Clostridia bacterium]